jgi:RNA polymerase sigma-70 factor (ECF subfamily)
MSWQQAFPLFLKPPDSRPIREIDQEILDELQFHIDMRAMDNIKAGMAPDAARQDASRRFGDFDRIHKKCRNTLLGERIMLQRVQTVLTVVLLVAVIFLSVVVYRGQRTNEAATAQMASLLTQLSDPIVVDSVPKTGDMDVDPALSEIRVTYNKTMADKSWSWCHEPDLFASSSEPHYESDGKTCVLPVKLTPGKEYLVSLNTEQFRNFQDTTGRSAVPYLLHFKTREK